MPGITAQDVAGARHDQYCTIHTIWTIRTKAYASSMIKASSPRRPAKTVRASSARKMPASAARDHFSDVMTDVGVRGDRLILQRNGKDLVAVVPVADLELLEALEDRMDLAAAKAALKERGSVSWAQVKAKLDL
jgi:prevent-host-death family protein